MIDHAVDLLREAGVSAIFANTHHLPDRIEPHLSEVGVTWRREHPDILDTGGGLKALAPLLPAGPVITLNPDAAWRGSNPISMLIDAWSPGMQCLMLLLPVARTDRVGHGDFSLSKGRIARKGEFVFTGAQIIRPDLVEGIEGDVFSLNAVWDRLIASGDIDAIVYDGDWRDIGTPEGLAALEAEFTDV